MAERELISPPKTVKVSFSLEPAHNGLNSLMLLNDAEEISGFGEWVYQTSRALTPEMMHDNWLIISGLNVECCLGDKAWPSFPAWVDYLAEQDPALVRDHQLQSLCCGICERLDESPPALDQLLANRAMYLSLVERVHLLKDHVYDPALWEATYDLFLDPPAMQGKIVSHLRMMWNEFLAEEWERSLPMLEQSVATFKALDLSSISVAEAISRVAKRDLPAQWEDLQEKASQLIFIPSPHIGPYLLLSSFGDATARITFGARVPEGVFTSFPTLDRSELLMRLNALADDTRLRIIELLTEEGELGAQDIMTRLDLSQSAASRHLLQLSATGYLTVRRHEGAKLYRLNPDRVDDTLNGLRGFFH